MQSSVHKTHTKKPAQEHNDLVISVVSLNLLTSPDAKGPTANSLWPPLFSRGRISGATPHAS